MTIKQVKTGWQVNIQPGGRGGKRVKKTFPTKAEAIAWERHVRAKVQEQPDWAAPKRDARPLSDFVDIWFKHHGVGLSDGERRKRILEAMCEALSNPRADKFSADMFAEYRSQQLDGGIQKSTLNHRLAYMKAMFNELRRLGHWKKENPVKSLRPFKLQERELSYLRGPQIEQLLGELKSSTNKHVHLIAKVCLATGARWSEGENLTITQLHNSRIQFANTKSKKVRAVPIRPELAVELEKHHEAHGQGNRIFGSAYAAFREGIERAEIVLPKGQLSHSLRHTFASHFMMNGGNILALQRILGHSDLKMTMVYAHLAPEHLEEAVRLNPLNSLQC
ncbi:MAG TPA: tyrosine-type recombinase/integrase [Rhodocyclaceae bacterium]|nr:tyrosine-type recombinase/integrase [Rhodocyclaceae bacterium]